MKRYVQHEDNNKINCKDKIIINVKTCPIFRPPDPRRLKTKIIKLSVNDFTKSVYLKLSSFCILFTNTHEFKLESNLFLCG